MSLDLHNCLGVLGEALQAGAALMLVEPSCGAPAWAGISWSENAAFPLMWWQLKAAMLVCPNDDIDGCWVGPESPEGKFPT